MKKQQLKTHKINVGSQNGEQSLYNGDHLITDTYTVLFCFYMPFLSQSINCAVYTLIYVI